MLQRTSSSRHVDSRSMHSYVPAHRTIVQEVTAKAPVCLIKSLFHSLVGYIDTRLSRRKGMFRSIHRNTMLVHSQVFMPYKREGRKMLWPALLAMSWACFMTPWPWLDASSPPERVASPSFCPVDFWPSGSGRVSYMFSVQRGRGRYRTRLDGAGNAVTSSGEALAGLLGGGLLGVGGDCDGG
jgi:hypothetical protein